MQIREIMSRDVRIADVRDNLRQAAQLMATQDVGALPVGDQGRLVGIVTDRDIVVRAVAEGRAPEETPVSEVMSQEVLYCFDEDDIEDAAREMSELQIRRIPVLDRERRLVGVVALADIARHVDTPRSGRVLQQISEPPGQHRPS